MARKYGGKERTFKKTFAERYIDRVMNDGVERSTHQVVDAIITYIENLMCVVVDKDQDDFVKELALNELRRLNVDISNFLNKHINDDKDKEKTIKKLLQEEKDNG